MKLQPRYQEKKRNLTEFKKGCVYLFINDLTKGDLKQVLSILAEEKKQYRLAAVTEHFETPFSLLERCTPIIPRNFHASFEFTFGKELKVYAMAIRMYEEEEGDRVFCIEEGILQIHTTEIHIHGSMVLGQDKTVKEYYFKVRGFLPLSLLSASLPNVTAIVEFGTYCVGAELQDLALSDSFHLKQVKLLIETDMSGQESITGQCSFHGITAAVHLQGSEWEATLRLKLKELGAAPWLPTSMASIVQKLGNVLSGEFSVTVTYDGSSSTF
eukprot:PhF_6_TR18467/c0_g2_i1/m.27040